MKAGPGPTKISLAEDSEAWEEVTVLPVWMHSIVCDFMICNILAAGYYP